MQVKRRTVHKEPELHFTYRMLLIILGPEKARYGSMGVIANIYVVHASRTL